MADQAAGQSKDENALSVVDRVLAAFVKAIGEEDGYGDVAERLRATLLDKRDMNEAALARALFEVEEP